MHRIKNNMDVEHHPWIQQLTDSIDKTEKAVLSRNIAEIIRVYDEALPVARKYVPHFQNARIRGIFAKTINHVEELLVKLRSEDANLGYVDEFLRKVLAQSTILLGEILIEVEKPVESKISN